MVMPSETVDTSRAIPVKLGAFTWIPAPTWEHVVAVENKTGQRYTWPQWEQVRQDRLNEFPDDSIAHRLARRAIYQAFRRPKPERVILTKSGLDEYNSKAKDAERSVRNALRSIRLFGG